MPRFTVVIPCHNAAATLPATLASLEAQALTDWEALLIDDGSTDGTFAIIDAAIARDPRIRACSAWGNGPAAARNVAVTEARGDIIAFLDADDTWEPLKLSRMHTLFRDPEIDGVFARVAVLDEAGHVRSEPSVPSGDLGMQTLLGENPVRTLSNLCIRREAFVATNGFKATMLHNEHLEWLVRIVAEGYRVVALNEVLVRQATRPGALSSDLAAMRAGRAMALATAARYGHRPGARAEAIHLRDLARRALGSNAPAREVLALALAGAMKSPTGFFSDPRRGGATLMGALFSGFMSTRTRAALFAV
ncbi:glycosyltransferase family 2 protein [Roseivivax isoporae]|uniref:Glucosyl transferase n=1 Tax=Roseivivax isoporae LMG 25204 TaxID=1449351 RepID=X7FD69_9RHOB|nr:glycosyltransferase family A protein [Roseivivax isoporae]ETX30760.1 glucosyl transferase [Roseivivax isoporae LMG 25204]